MSNYINKIDKRKMLKNLGEMCKNIRKIQNKTVEEFAKINNIPQSDIQEFETGKLDSAYILNLYLALEFD